MKPIIEIQYRDVPVEIVTDFEKTFDKSVHVIIHHDQEDHFEPSDILIWVKDIVPGVLEGAIWDAIKTSVATTWKKLVAYRSKQNKKAGEVSEIKLVIELKHTIEYHLPAGINPKNIDELVEKMDDFFPKRKTSESRIELSVNGKLKKWEKAKANKQNKKLFKLLIKKLSS